LWRDSEVKRSLGILALLGFVLLIGAGYCEAASTYPTRLEYRLGNQVLLPGEVIQITPGNACVIEVYGSFFQQSISGDVYPEMTGSYNPSGVITAAFEAYEDRPNDLIGTITAFADDFGSVSAQYTIHWKSVFGQDVYMNTPFTVWFVSVSPWQCLQPKGITLRDEYGSEVRSIQMTAGDVRTFYVEVDDYNNDGLLDNNFEIVNPTNVTYSTNVTNSNAIAATDSVPYLVIHRMGDNLPTRLSTVKITALNPGGTQNSPYEDMYAQFFWRLSYEFGESGSSQAIDTQSISILVTARDDAGGNYDDGGGTCNAAGLGFMALLLSLALIRKRK